MLRTQPLPVATAFRCRVDEVAESLRDVIRYARANAPRGGHPYTNLIAKDILSRPRRQSLEHITAFVLDLAQRGDLQGAESIGRELIAQARLEYARTRATQADVPIVVAHLEEEHAEGVAEEAETSFAHEPSRMNAEMLIQTGNAHITAKERLLDRVRRQYVGAP